MSSACVCDGAFQGFRALSTVYAVLSCAVGTANSAASNVAGRHVSKLAR
jgi:hypothetical protein